MKIFALQNLGKEPRAKTPGAKSGNDTGTNRVGFHIGRFA